MTVIKSRTADDVRKLLRHKAKEAGSQIAFALAVDISPQFLSDVINGRREPSGRLLEVLGLRRIVRYE